MARFRFGTTVWPAALGAVAALMLAAPAAADPAAPGPPPGPPPGPVEAAVQPAAGDAPPTEVPHLSSPDNLPPGTTELPDQPDGPRVGYLRELWHAYQTQEVSGGDALLLLTQRPMDAAAKPPPGMSNGPQPALAPPPTQPVPEAPAPAPAPAGD